MPSITAEDRRELLKYFDPDTLAQVLPGATVTPVHQREPAETLAVEPLPAPGCPAKRRKLPPKRVRQLAAGVLDSLKNYPRRVRMAVLLTALWNDA